MSDNFSRDIEGLEPAAEMQESTIAPGRTFDLKASPVRKRIGEAEVRMLAYNGSIPGPALRVRQGSEITVRFDNELELDTTVHWHGLRHDYLYDGVPNTGHHRGMQAPVHPGESLHLQAALPRPRRVLVPPAHARGLHAGDGPLRQHHRGAATTPPTGPTRTASWR